MDQQTPLINRLLDLWLDEDLGRGDLTSVALDQNGSAYWIAKQPGIFCGTSFVNRLFKRLDSAVVLRFLVPSGVETSRFVVHHEMAISNHNMFSDYA